MMNGVNIANVERELTVNQRNLIDTCFEEGNYDAAISLLDKLRHPNCKPYPVHLRNLVYIALYPPQIVDEPDYTASKLDVISASPSKISARNQHSFFPTPEHSAAAQRVLRAFAQTNSPASICRALPSYDSSVSPTPGKTIPSRQFAEVSDSEISRRSKRIIEAKNCWELLRENFVQAETYPAQDYLSTQNSRLRRTRRSYMNGASEPEEMDSDAPDPVGPLAWPLLDWLLTVFEKDELTCNESDKCDEVLAPSAVPDPSIPDRIRLPLGHRSTLRHSVLLLSGSPQIEPWLATTQFVDQLSVNDMRSTSILSLLPPTVACTQFKVALCKTSLTRIVESKPTQKPMPKTAPRPQPARHRQPSSKDSSIAPSTISPETAAPTIARKYPVVTAAEVVQLVSRSSSTPESQLVDTTRTLQFKFQLLCAFGALQERSSHRDEDWEQLVQNGELPKAIDQGFGCWDDDGLDVQVWAQDFKATLAIMGWYR
ncbi:hypothetical protein NM688_g4272 [Phlebia brevispora]|uniref:Uncharacterized protein n=1 Tax=Phlebia brevispora TaxID=194682 RepID=A0ACC1T3I9_9APHY|nr:hypothetical protein NM688_g4272 [Phlebia brevispora]